MIKFCSLFLTLSFFLSRSFGTIIIPDLNSLIPTVSQYDQEIETLLGQINPRFSYLKDIFNGSFNDTHLLAFDLDILSHSFGPDFKKIKRLCFLGIKRNNEWMVEACNLFRQGLGDNPNWYQLFDIAAAHLFDRPQALKFSTLRFGMTIIEIQVNKFISKLQESLPKGYDFEKVNYVKVLSLVKELNKELIEIIMKNWFRNLENLWSTYLISRPIIMSHRKFWLKFLTFSEGESQKSPDIGIIPFVKYRDTLLRNFFESDLFKNVDPKDVISK